MIKELKEVYMYRQMLFSLVKKDLRSRYRGSFFGFLWTFINPLMQLVIYSLVFPFLLKMQEENYSMYVFVGLLPWIFFTSSLQIATTSIVANGNLVKKIYFPRMILPFSVASTGVMNYIFGLVIVFAAILFSKISLSFYALLLPLVILSQYIFVVGMCLILSSLYVYFRDLEHIVGIVIMAWFYVTPVVFNISVFPPYAQKILLFNPMTQYISAYRNVLMYSKPPDLVGFLSVTLAAVLIFILGLWVFKRLERSFAEEI